MMAAKPRASRNHARSAAILPLMLAALGATTPTRAAPAPAPAASTPAGAPRSTMTLAEGWRFQLGDDLTGAERIDYPDADWQVVSVPHTWNHVGQHLVTTPDHDDRPEQLNKTQGVGWYRLRFDAPARNLQQRVWLEFDAASRTAEVWLNGKRLGRHDGGFSRFRLDATDALRPGPNVLAVKTDNLQPKYGNRTADILPLTGDFFVHGGLYRPVRLVTTGAAHIDMLDHGGPGVYATTTAIDGRGADVAVRMKLQNDGSRSRDLRVVARLVDAAGGVAASMEQPVSLRRGQGVEVARTLRVADAHLWQGVADPYLYALQVELRDAGGATIDRLDQPFGIRQIRLDADRGLILNGKPLRLRGVGLHQDREGKGWALSEADIADDIATIRDMGANTIRLTHYQHGTPIHALADRYGLILWDEIPLVTGWTLGPDQTEASPGLVANARQQLQELIRQNYNHASVAVWGIANEVDFGPNRPDFLGVAPKVVADPMPLLRLLDGLAKQEDPGRPSALATCCEDGFMRNVPVVAGAADTAGANRYYGWYYGATEGLGPHLDALHAKRPAQPLALSEYGGGGAISIHSDDPRGGPIDPGGRVQPEEYQAWLHEQSWHQIASRPYLWATWLWNGFDFSSTARREGDALDINTKGLVSYDRRTRKDAFFFYRANWSDQPTVHITGRRYADRAYPAADVKVYSNASATDLLVNGRSLGVRRDCPDRVCVWPAVRLPTGASRIAAVGTFAAGPVRDEIEWRVDPAAARGFRIDAGAIVAAATQDQRFGSDAFFAGGAAGTVDTPGGRGRKPVFATIAGTARRDVAATFREGDFTYRLPVADGRYMVKLTFVEPAAATGQRLFDVVANGAVRLRRLNVAAAAGAPLTAIERSFPVSVKGGEIALAFRPIEGKAIVSAIEVVPAGG